MATTTNTNAIPEPDSDPDTDAATAEQDEIERNITSLIAIPWEQCPWPAVRLRMLRIAIEGAEIYAYTHGPFPDGSIEWVIWDNTQQPGADNRFSPRAWANRYGYAIGDETIAESKEGA